MGTLDPVVPGQNMRPPAAAWNALMEMLRWWQASGGAGGGVGPGWPAGGLVCVRNVSEYDVPRFGVLAVTAPLFTPSDNLREFQQVPVVTGDSPTGPLDVGGLVIALQPIPAGEMSIGRALAVGICPVQVDVTDAGHLFADTADGDVEVLHSASSGPVRIVAKESGTGTKWAYVSLPAGGGAAVAYAKVAAVYNAAGDGWTDFPTDGFPYFYEVNPCNSVGGNVGSAVLAVLACTAPLYAFSGTICAVGDVIAWMPGDGAVMVPASDPERPFDGYILPGFGGLGPLCQRVMPGP
jgi:hypothetical protein